MISEPWNLPDLKFLNGTSALASSPGGVEKSDDIYVGEEVRKFQPVVLIACGEYAHKQVRRMRLEVGDGRPRTRYCLLVPHPAYRLVTNELFDKAKEILQQAHDGHERRGIISLVQKRGEVEVLRE
jgi:hypothetical protein